MHETVRDEVLIDVCPHCRGVWLDRGELDKLMERVYLPDDASVTYLRAEGAVQAQTPELAGLFRPGSAASLPIKAL